MKKLQYFLLAGLLLATTTIHAQVTAEEVIKKYLTAIGGEDAWKKVNTMKSTGSMSAQGMELTMVLTAVHGKGFRSDYTIMGINGFSIITPTAGWVFTPGAETKLLVMTAEQVQESQDQLDIQGELVDYKAKGHTVEYIGKEAYEGVPCYKLKLTLKSGTVSTWYIDVATNYLIRTVSKSKAEGAEDDVNLYSNHKKLPEGITIPMTLGTANGDINLKEIEINKPVDEKVFTPAG